MKFRYLITLIFVILCNLSVATANLSIIDKVTNSYGSKWVYDQYDLRCLSFSPPPSSIVQTCVNLKTPDILLLNYQKLVLAALYINSEPKKILVIGLGGATLPRALEKILPNTKIDIVEIDKDIAKLAEKHFFFKTGENIRVFVDDGFAFVKRAEAKTYDLIIVDAFNEEYVPPSFLTLGFVSNIKKLLTDKGVVAVNSFGETNKHYKLESDLYNQVFGQFINITNGSRVMLASNSDFPLVEEIREQSAKWQVQFRQLGVDSAWLLDKLGIKDRKVFPSNVNGFTVPE